MTRRRLPPFGRSLRAALASGWRPANRTLFVAAGATAWATVRDWRCPPTAFLVLPPDSLPRDFSWPRMDGLDAAILISGAASNEIIERLALILIERGAALVYAGRLDCRESGQSWARQEAAA